MIEDIPITLAWAREERSRDKPIGKRMETNITIMITRVSLDSAVSLSMLNPFNILGMKPALTIKYKAAILNVRRIKII